MTDLSCTMSRPSPNRIRTRPSAHRIRDLLNYDKRTGALTWRVDKGRAKAGDEAGTIREDGCVVITIDNYPCMAIRLIWLYVNGEWPEGRMTTYNRDGKDLRWRNIMQEKETWARTAGAAYQREYRRRMRNLRYNDSGELPSDYYDPADPRDPVRRERYRKTAKGAFDRDSGISDVELFNIKANQKAAEEHLAYIRTLPGVKLGRKPGRPKGSKNRANLPPPDPNAYQPPTQRKTRRDEDTNE